MSAAFLDFRHAVRGLLKHPGYAITATLTLALGIGFSTATFSVVNAVVLRPLPFEAPEDLVRILERNLPRFPRFSVSPGHYLFWRDHNTTFTGIGAWASQFVNVDADGLEPVRMRADRVSTSLLPLLGVAPQLGRSFTVDDEQGGRAEVAVLSHAVWQQQFGGNPNILGRAIRIDRQAVTIVGVMPPDFRFPSASTQLWVPLVFTPVERQNFGSHYMGAIGRLKPGATIDSATRDMAQVSRRVADVNPGSQGWEVLLFDLQTFLAGDLRTPLFVLLGAVSLVLLIACGNVANLLLVRGASRQKELAIRASIGASRGRLIRKLIVEQLTLATVSGAAGVLLAGWLLRLLIALMPGALPSYADVRLDPTALLFAVVLVVLTPLVFGLLPAIQAARPDLRTVIAAGGRHSILPAAARTRTTLVVAEIALAMALLVGAGHLVRSFSHLVQQSPGFAAEGAVLSSVSLPADAYPTPEVREQFLARFLDGVRGVADVAAVGVSMPMAMVNEFNSSYEVEGQPSPDGQNPITLFYAVSPGLLDAMRIPLLRGRFITDDDRRAGQRVVVINQALAEKHFGDDNPIGRRMRVSQGDNAWREIVGVVGNVKQMGLDEQPRAQVYESYLQHPYFASFALVVRANAGQPTAVVPQVRSVLRGIAPDLPLADVRRLDDVVADTVTSERFSTALIVTFGLAALLLASVGVYGVIAYTVGLRRHEFAIRVAHGARPGDLLRLVLHGAVGMSVVGILIGAFGAWLLRGVLERLLFEVSSADPLIYGAVAILLTAAALTATAVPAVRSTRVDPAEALRGE
jgi:putative ABC transport system permease protein